MSKRDGKDLMGFLELSGMIDYDKFIPADTIRDQLGLVYPETASLKEYRQLELQEMAAVDYVRLVLLGQGMYLRGVTGGYRILTISENFLQVDLYMDSADRKLRRAMKLLRNTPKQPDRNHSQQEVRVAIKMEKINNRRTRNQPPEARI